MDKEKDSWSVSCKDQRVRKRGKSPEGRCPNFFLFFPFHLTDILSSVSLMVPDHLTTVSPVTHNECKQKPIGVGLYSVMVRQWQVTFTSVSGHLQGAAVCWCVSPSWTCMIWLQARSHLPALIGFSTCTLARGLSLMGSLPSSVNGRLP